jgi:hypothetical protein
MYAQDKERFERISEPFVIADYGTATGFSSIETFQVILTTVRKINPALPIVIYLNDLPNNNHENALLTVLGGIKEFEKVFVYIAGADFTKEVFPNEFVDICFSHMSLPTLPNHPSHHTNYCFFASDKILATEDGKIWHNAMEDHITKFTASRGKELKKNGFLLIVTQSYSLDSKIHE